MTLSLWRIPAGARSAYDISGPETTTYRDLLFAYARASNTWRAGVPPLLEASTPGWYSRLPRQPALPVPGGLAADLVESSYYPMRASDHRLDELLPSLRGGPTPIDDAIAASLSSRKPAPVDALADPHHLADSDPGWAGGDVLALQRLASAVTPAHARPALGLVNPVPGPVAGVLRTGFDLLTEFAPNGKSA